MASRSASTEEVEINEAVIKKYFQAVTEAQSLYELYDMDDPCRVESLVTSSLWVAMEEMVDRKFLAVDDAEALVAEYHKSLKKRTDITFMQKQVLFFKETLLPLVTRGRSSGAKDIRVL